MPRRRKGGSQRARYLVVHKVPPSATQDQVIDAAKQVIRALPPGADWLSSWAAAEAERLFCDWEAEDEKVLGGALEPIRAFLPVEAMHPVAWIDPSWYRA